MLCGMNVHHFLTTHTYTDLHTALCNEEKACVSVCNSELNDENSDKSLMMYKSEAFKKMLRYPMFVEGVMIEFLADSGASRSYLRPCDLPYQPSLTDKTNESVSASGHTSVERLIVPLNCETDGGICLFIKMPCVNFGPRSVMQTKFDASCELLRCQSERRGGAMVLFASRAKVGL